MEVTSNTYFCGIRYPLFYLQQSLQTSIELAPVLETSFVQSFENRSSLGSCSFDNDNCDWINLPFGDQFDWERHYGRTGTLGTGPEEDHSGRDSTYPRPPPPPSSGGGYSTGIWVGGFGRLNETLTLFKTQKMPTLLPCLRESAVISYPVQDWTKQAVFKTLKMVHKFAFSRILTEGGEKEKICGDDPV